MTALSLAPMSEDPRLPLLATTHDICVDQYAAEVSPFFKVTPIAKDGGQNRIMVHAWQSEFFVLGEAVSGPLLRARAKQEAQDAGHLVEISRYLVGFEQGVIRGDVLDRASGRIFVLDQGLRMKGVSHNFHAQQIYVPKAVLGIAPDVLARGAAIDPTYPNGRLLDACITQLYETAKAGADSIPSGLYHRLIALLKVNLGVSPHREDVRTQLRNSLFEQICLFIEKNLVHPELSTTSILQRFGVSHASLYRMFEDQGGVRAYITQRRVVRAVLEIQEDPLARGRMRRVAQRSGFSSQPNFNRTIRKKFGTSPSGLFRHLRRAPARRVATGDILGGLATRTAALA